MTQEQLNTELDYIIDAYDNPVEYAYTETELKEMLLNLIKQHITDVIGEDEDPLIMDFTKGRDRAVFQEVRNKLRMEQRERAGLKSINL